MAEYVFGGTEEENAELRKFNQEVNEDPDNFESWEKLVRRVELQEGGLGRNSNPQAITAARAVYDRFLACFPLLFGYWKKYADLEFSVAGTEAAEMVYERGVASISNSVDLWANYCSFKAETCHEPDIIRDLFERGAKCVGLDFLAHLFWDKYIEFEERNEAMDKIFAILSRVIKIPMHQYARYIERHRQMAQLRPVSELAPPDVLATFRAEIDSSIAAIAPTLDREAEIEREMQSRIAAYHLEILTRTQSETTKRWTYEAEVKRPYFHVTELDEGQLANWRRYLDFEEAEGDYDRIQFLYERCLVTCSLYEEFWFRYARWMLAQDGKEEEVRNIYQRASAIYVPIAHPAIRLHYAYFEEMCGRIDIAKDILSAVLMRLPGHLESILSLANLSRRHGGFEAAIEVYKAHLDSPHCDMQAKAVFVAEWAKLLWKIKGAADEAREVYEKNEQWYLDSRAFWQSYLSLELEQPTSEKTESTAHERIKHVIHDIRTKSQLTPETIKEMVQVYMTYLLQRGGGDAAREYMVLDREINGPVSIQYIMSSKQPQAQQQSQQTPIAPADAGVVTAGTPAARSFANTPVATPSPQLQQFPQTAMPFHQSTLPVNTYPKHEPPVDQQPVHQHQPTYEQS